MSKKKIAVFFGGRSPEHDVSIVSGLQVLHAVDMARYDAFPVYVAPDGAWLCGDDALLKDRNNYMLSKENRESLRTWTLDVSSVGKPRLISEKKGLFDNLCGSLK